MPGQRLRLAYFSPLLPAKSGIADYSAELLPGLAEHVDLTLFADEPGQVSLSIRERFPVLAISAYPARRMEFDLALYHVGNSMHHAPFLPTMLRYPGILVLHDYGLHDLIGTITAGRDDFVGYMREIGYVRGLPGINQIRDARLRSRGVVLPDGIERNHVELRDLSLSERLVDSSLGVVVHSEYIRQLVQSQTTAPQHRTRPPVEVIPHLVAPLEGSSRRNELPWPADSLIFASIGFINEAKHLPLALRAFARLRESHPEARYLIVGEMLAGLNLKGLVSGLGLQNMVHFAGFAPDLAAFRDWLATADVLVNLRYPTRGETSGAVLRALAVGRPVIINDVGWYAELPGTVCLRIPVQDESAVLHAMRYCARNPAARREMGAAGQAYVRERLAPQPIAAHYVAFLQSLVKRPVHQRDQRRHR